MKATSFGKTTEWWILSKEGPRKVITKPAETTITNRSCVIVPTTYIVVLPAAMAGKISVNVMNKTFRCNRARTVGCDRRRRCQSRDRWATAGIARHGIFISRKSWALPVSLAEAQSGSISESNKNCRVWELWHILFNCISHGPSWTGERWSQEISLWLTGKNYHRTLRWSS